MELVVEEVLISQSSFFLESELLGEGYARLVFCEGPPSDLVEVQLFKRLPQQKLGNFRSVSLAPFVPLSNTQSHVSIVVFACPSVKSYRAPSDRFPAGFLFDHVASYF